MNSWLFCFSTFCVCGVYSNETIAPLKEHEMWWEQSLGRDASFETFESWLGDENASSRMAMRRSVIENNYRSILDIPCGICIDYYGFKKAEIAIDYLGIDITPQLVELAKRQDIPVILGSIESIPLSDSSFDLVYARHILEHLSGYKDALKELIRVAKDEVLIVFFIRPNDSSEDLIKLPLIDTYPIYHNGYSKSQLEECLKDHEKVDYWVWENLPTEEEILHIFCK